jgi:hypothetical protein
MPGAYRIATPERKTVLSNECMTQRLFTVQGNLMFYELPAPLTRGGWRPINMGCHTGISLFVKVADNFNGKVLVNIFVAGHQHSSRIFLPLPYVVATPTYWFLRLTFHSIRSLFPQYRE